MLLSRIDSDSTLIYNKIMNELELIKSIINQNLDPTKFKVFIFGSRAMGQQFKYSDYDIGIEGKPLTGQEYS